MNHDADPDFSLRDALDMLAFQVELGADEAIGDTPVNRFDAPPPVQKPADDTPTAVEPVAVVSAGPDDAGAGALAEAAPDLAALRRAIEGFEGCSLKRGSRNTVFSDGNPAARVMIVGEAPGREEDIEGKPFVGRSGQLLDRMLAAIALSRDATDPSGAVYITNVLPWRPPQNREPSTDEALMMKAFLLRHIELAAPEILITMGNSATRTVLDVETGITRMRGRWAEHNGIPVMPMFHPAALLRNPIHKREAWADLLDIKARLNA